MPARAVAIVIDDGELVVMQRNRGGSAYYTLPGGAVEPGESSAEACVRELREETGLDGRVVREVITLDNRGRREHYSAWPPLAKLADVDLRPDDVRRTLMRLASDA